MLLKKIINADLSLKLFVTGMSVLYLHEVLLSFAVMHMTIAYTGFIFLFLSCCTAIMEGKLNYLEHKYAYWLLAIWLFAFFMLLHGAFLGHDLRYISRDLWAFCFFACLLAAAKKDNWIVLDQMIYFQFTFTIILVLYIWSFYGLNITREILQQSSNSFERLRLAWAWGLLYSWPYMLLTYKRSSLLRRMISALGFTIFFILALMYEKRNPMVFLILFIGLYIVFAKHRSIAKTMTSKRLVYKFVSVLLAVTILGTGAYLIVRAQETTGYYYVTKIIDKSSFHSGFINTLLHDPRLDSIPKDIIAEAEAYQIVVGQGLGSTILRSSVQIQSVENGLMLLFFKGGILYTIAWCFGLLNILTDLFRRRKKSVVSFQIMSSVIIIMSPIVPFFHMGFLTGYIMLWFGRSMARS
ncbi:MAG: hypothetical protein LWX02_05505 [Deltaproteobacteria bacterium]|jgi:hypothetical protein|nr:hypothetical protein [Deltaproteobacteria bacterium]MDL1987765.1 hypothetical protein [Deltaproteobacteria bacterium]